MFLTFVVGVHSGCGEHDWKTTCKLAQNITTFAMLQNSVKINGIELKELNRRALPLPRQAGVGPATVSSYDECDSECFYFIQAAGLDPMVRSFSGFMAQNETLRSVLEADWLVVHDELRSSHIELAGHLRALLGSSACRHSPDPQHCNVTYNASTLPGNTVRQRTPQQIQVQKSITNGCQCSLFWNNNTASPGKPGPSDPPGLFNDGWSCTYRLTNLASNRTIDNLGASCDGAHANGTVLWIEQLGFYEGSTPYRVSPAELYGLIQGDTGRGREGSSPGSPRRLQ